MYIVHVWWQSGCSKYHRIVASLECFGDMRTGARVKWLFDCLECLDIDESAVTFEGRSSWLMALVFIWIKVRSLQNSVVRVVWDDVWSLETTCFHQHRKVVLYSISRLQRSPKCTVLYYIIFLGSINLLLPSVLYSYYCHYCTAL